MMHWESPSFLLGLWVIPPLVALLIAAQRRRQRALEVFVHPLMVSRLVPAWTWGRIWWKLILLSAGVGLIIIGISRPRFGVYFDEVVARGVDLVVVLDVSRSMLADDVAPNRLERAKADIVDLLERVKGDRVGLIAFAGAPVVLVPLTTDQGFFKMALQEAGPRSAPRGGTLIGDALRKGIELLEHKGNRDQAMLLITDGEDQDSFPLEAAKQAAERKIRVFTVGLGDPSEGARIPDRNADGSLKFVQHEGKEVWSKMHDQTLREIAEVTAGAYVPAQTRAYDLGKIYDEHLSKLSAGEMHSEQRRRYRERYQWFGGIGLFLLLLDRFLSRFIVKKSVDDPFDRQSSAEPSPQDGKRHVSVARLLFLLAPLVAVAAGPSKQAAQKVKEGLEQFSNGQFAQAAQSFAEAEEVAPEEEIVIFDRACALSASGDYEKARELFLSLAMSKDLSLSTSAHFNLGGIAAREGHASLGKIPADAKPEQREEGVAHLLKAIGHYRDCLRHDPQHADARHNLELIRLFIKHIQSVWEQRDREQARKERNLLEFITYLEEKQFALRSAVKAFQTEPTSARQRQARSRLKNAQQLLEEEIPVLREKIREQLIPPEDPQAASSGGNPDPEKLKQMEQALSSIVAELSASIRNAADRIGEEAWDQVEKEQRKVIDRLHDLFAVFVSFPSLVQRAIADQQALLDAHGVETSDTTSEDQTPLPQVTIDFNESHWKQKHVTQWSHVLGQKARYELANLESQGGSPESQGGAEESPDQKIVPDTQAPPDGPTADPPTTPDAQGQQMDALRKALEKGVELSPEIVEHSLEAEDQLKRESAKEGKIEQQETLRLLKEIADLLPKEENQSDDKDNQQNDQEQKQPDRDQGDQQSKDQQDSSSDQKPDPQTSKEREEQSAKERAQSVLRKAREREEQYRELQRQIQQLRGGPIPVERDW